MGYFSSEFSSTDGGIVSFTRALKSLPIGTSMKDTRGRVIAFNVSLSSVFISQSNTLSPVYKKNQNLYILIQLSQSHNFIICEYVEILI